MVESPACPNNRDGAPIPSGRTLRPRRIAYTSFKFCNFEGMHNGRYLTDFTEPTLQEFLSVTGADFSIEQLYATTDVRPESGTER